MRPALCASAARCTACALKPRVRPGAALPTADDALGLEAAALLEGSGVAWLGEPAIVVVDRDCGELQYLNAEGEGAAALGKWKDEGAW